MKKALRLFLAYFLWLILGTLVGTFFYNLYLHSLELVAGVESPVFDWEHLVRSFFLVTQVLAFISGFLILGYKIRKPGNSLQFLVYIICQFISICVIFPVSYHFEKKLISENQNFFDQEKQTLSPGFFRESESTQQIFFFLNESNDCLVQIDTRDTGSSIYKENSPSALETLTKEAAPYRDVLIKNSFSSKKSPFSFFLSIIDAGKKDIDLGITFWIGFMSITLALTSIYAFSGFTNWRIVNYSLCGILYGAVLFLNGFFWSPLLEGFRNSGFMNSGFLGFLKHWTSSPFLIICNLIFALIFTVTGTINFFVRKKRGR